MSRPIFLLAGEASGDARGAELIRALRAKNPSLTFCGMGGKQMRDEGMEILADVCDLAVVGIVEVLKNYRFFKQTMDRLFKEIQKRKPLAVIGVDYPGFNLRLLQKVHSSFFPNDRQNTKLIQYISPQIWAWNEARKWKMAAYLDLVLCIFPFEPLIYEKTGLKAVFVGHPLAERIFRSEDGRDPHVVAFFPGSREKELRAHMPVLAKLETQLKKNRPNLQIAYASTTPQNTQIIRSFSPDAQIEIPSSLYDSAMVGVVCSGTATLEAALAGLPICVIYRVAWPTYWMGRILIKVPFLAMPNVMMGYPLVHELIQSKCTVAQLIPEMEHLLDDPNARSLIRKGYQELRTRLGNGEASKNAAFEILKLI